MALGQKPDRAASGDDLKCTSGAEVFANGLAKWIRHRHPGGALVMAVALLQLGCSQSEMPAQKVIGGDVAPGVLSIDILEGGQPSRYWQYEVRPSTGVVRVLRDETFTDYKHEDVPRTFQQPAGTVETCSKSPRALSPDGTLLAYCSRNSSDELYVIDQRSNATVCEWKSPKQIRGFAWSPNSGSLAILNAASHTGMKPLDLIALVSGHPVPHDTVFLDFLNIKTRAITEYVIRRNVMSAFTRILEWSAWA